MDNKIIFERLVKILNEDLGVKTALGLNTALIREGILDSMDFANYLTQVENSFNLRISNEEVVEHELGVVGNMVSFLARRSVSEVRNP